MIADGIQGTAMQSWSQRFREPQIILLAAYVASLRGTEPASPKAPEGNTIAPWPTPAEGTPSAPEDVSTPEDEPVP